MLPNINNTKKIFVRKSYLPQLYKWSPGTTTYIPNVANKTKIGGAGGNVKPSFCNATAGSQGQDWTTTYVYNITVVNYEQQRSAYVECDYVQ